MGILGVQTRAHVIREAFKDTGLGLGERVWRFGLQKPRRMWQDSFRVLGCRGLWYPYLQLPMNLQVGQPNHHPLAVFKYSNCCDVCKPGPVFSKPYIFTSTHANKHVAPIV